MTAAFPVGAKAYGQSLRAATETERVAGTDKTGAYVQRACGRKCVALVEFVASHRMDDVAGVSRIFKRFVCKLHAERFARRYDLQLPPPLPVDQRLLPFWNGPRP